MHVVCVFLTPHLLQITKTHPYEDVVHVSLDSHQQLRIAYRNDHDFVYISPVRARCAPAFTTSTTTTIRETDCKLWLRATAGGLTHCARAFQPHRTCASCGQEEAHLHRCHELSAEAGTCS